LGFAFEAFDNLGRPRQTDNGQPLDTQGTFADLGIDGSFTGAEDMLDMLLASPSVRTCRAQHWLQYLLARKLSPDGSFDTNLSQSLGNELSGNVGVRTFLGKVLASKAVTTIRVD